MVAGPSLEHKHRALTEAFSMAGIETAALDARLLLQHVLGLDHAQFISAPARLLSEAEAAQLEALAARRLSREPLSRIFGEAEFWSLPFYVSEATLDPRPDSETLIELALELMPAAREEAASLLDLGTGSGCLLLSLLSEWPQARGLGVDMAPEALATARRNAARLGLEARAEFQQSNWFGAVSGRYDLIISNPPYIRRADIAGLAPEVARFDPALALDGGVSGIEPYELIFAEAANYLSPGGWLIVEFGFGQLEEIKQALDASPLGSQAAQLLHRADLSGTPRCLAVEKRAL